MGRTLSKHRNISEDEDLRELSVDQISSCNLTEYWNEEKQKFNDNYLKNQMSSPIGTASDFQLSIVLDKGSFGIVALATHNNTGVTYAAKILTKKKIVKSKLVGRAHNEKRILESIDFPFVVRLEFFYQDNSYLYFVMPFACGGNIATHLNRYGPMDEDKARFYASGILLAVEYLQNLDLAHRDIKSENVLISIDGHSQLADFGFCKHVPGRTYTVCGTYEYLAPEIIIGQGYGKAADYWSLGIVLYEMVAGYTPFSANSIGKILRKISDGRYSCPSGFSGDLINLLRNMLRVDVTKRYGNLANGVKDIKKHRWFKPIDWCAFFHKQVTSPFTPTADDGDPEDCVGNFGSVIRGHRFSVSSTELHGDNFKDF